jgi:signal transduction histidine kinase
MDSSARLNFPLRWQLYLAPFVVALVATTVLLGYFLWNAYLQTQATVEVSLNNVAQVVEARIEASLRRIQNDLEHIAHDLPAAALELPNVERFAERIRYDLNNRVEFFPELSSYRIFDANGNSLYNSGQVQPTYSIDDRAYFRSAKANPQQPLHFSEAIVGKKTNQAVVVMAKPLTSADGRFVGLVIGALNMHYFNEMFSRLNLGPSGVIALRRIENGALLARWPEAPDALNVPYKPEHPMWPWIRSGNKEGTSRLTSQTDNIERFFVHRRLDNYPFFIVPGRTASEYLTGWRQTAMLSISFAILLLAGLGFYLRRQWQVRKQEIEHIRDLATARDQAEAANKAKTIFLATMSHELRTPMNGIMGMTALALRKATDPRQIDHLKTVKQSSEKLLALINSILEFSKAESETLAMDQTPFILADVLEVVSTHDSQRARDKGLEFLLELDPRLRVQALIGSRQHLEHILLALTDNAIKFTSQGSVTVRVKADEDTLKDIRLRFEVSDTGLGISAEDQPRLFTPFAQLDGSMAREYGGAGLGLALSQRLAQAMGGNIGVESQVGVGSNFWFSVRLGKSPDAVPTAST